MTSSQPGVPAFFGRAPAEELAESRSAQKTISAAGTCLTPSIPSGSVSLHGTVGGLFVIYTLKAKSECQQNCQRKRRKVMKNSGELERISLVKFVIDLHLEHCLDQP